MERRDFVRIRMAVPVRYAFVDAGGNRLPPGLSEGSTANLGSGGILLQGKIHDLAWVNDLLMRRIALALSVPIPAEYQPVQAMAKVAWLETIDPESRRCNMGLQFTEIGGEDQARLTRFVIRSQLG